MKLFILAVGDRRRASSRLRVWDHVDWLREQGYDLTADYVMPPNAQRITIDVAWRILVRWPLWAWLFIRADRILIQETLILAPLMWIKSWWKSRHVVFDFSDPVDTIGSGLRNRMQQLGFVAMTHGSNHVIVENAAYLTALRGEGITVSQFYGPVDVDRYQAAGREQPPRDKSVVRIGWTGSPGTLYFITPLFPVLDNLARSHRIELMLIGVKAIDYSFQHLAVYTREWNEAEEFQLVPSFDLGLFVLDGSERSKRRGAGKLFIYMASGVPFVATNLGIAQDILKLMAVGYPVDDLRAWSSVLIQAINSTSERKSMSSIAVKYAQQNMSYSAFRHHLTAALEKRGT